MPANAVGPGEEHLWRRAKAQAAAQGHKDDWGYIMTIFMRMKGGMSKSYTIPQYYKQHRIPGQIPNTKELPKEVRNAVPMPKPATRDQIEAFEGNVLTPEDVIRGLGFNPQEKDSWTRFIGQTARVAENEATFRKMVMERCREYQCNTELTRAISQRGLRYWLELQKAFVYCDPLSPDEFAKADPRGGKYHRRIPKPDGGYRYIYDESQYQNRQDAHINGQDASLSYATKHVVNCVEQAGDQGCPMGGFKDLVKKFGSKLVASVLQNNANGKLTFKGGKFRIAKEK